MELDDASLRAMRGNIDIIDLVTMLLVFPLFITSIFSGSWCMRRYNATRNRLYMFAYLVHPIYAILALLLARIWLLYYGVPVFGSSVRLGPFVPNSCAVLKTKCPETLWMPCYVGFVRSFLGQVMGTRHPDWTLGHIAFFSPSSRSGSCRYSRRTKHGAHTPDGGIALTVAYRCQSVNQI